MEGTVKKVVGSKNKIMNKIAAIKTALNLYLSLCRMFNIHVHLWSKMSYKIAVYTGIMHKDNGKSEIIQLVLNYISFLIISACSNSHTKPIYFNRIYSCASRCQDFYGR